jgi:exopolysaccharide production protein ExoZ
MSIPSEGKTVPSGHVVNLQALRAVAAVLVVCDHLAFAFDPFGIPMFGADGVDLFFVISGFIMVYTTAGKDVGAGAFLRNRISRIVPIYYIATLAVFFVALVAPKLVGHTSTDLMELLKSLLFIPFKKAGQNVQPVLAVGWTLNYEMFFYALFAIGLAFPSRARGLAATVAVLVVLAGIGVFGPYANVYLNFYSNPIVLEFAFGMVIAWISARAASFVQNARLNPVLLGTLILCSIVLVVLPPLWPPSDAARALECGVPAAIVVFCAVCLEANGFRIHTVALVAIGDASYAMYLSHQFVTQTFEKIYARLPHSPLYAGLTIVLALAITIGVSIVVHHWIEKPSTRYARRWLFAPTPRLHASAP